MLADGNGVFLHCFQKRRLHLGRGPVDLVRQDDVREDGTLLGLEIGLLRVVDERPHEVGGQEVGRKLDPLKRCAQSVGQRPHRKRLGEPGDALHENMAVRKQSDEQPFDHILLANDDAADLVQEAIHELARALDSCLNDFDISVHTVSCRRCVKADCGQC